MRRLVHRFRSSAGKGTDDSNPDKRVSVPPSRPTSFQPPRPVSFQPQPAPFQTPQPAFSQPLQPVSPQSTLDSRQRNPEISLHDAAFKGLTQTVRWRLAEGVPINAPDSRDSTALHLAIRQGHVETTQLLLEWGADIEASSGPLSVKPAHLAAMTCNPALMETLLKYHPNLESKSNGLTALYYAISAGSDSVVRLLLEAGADARARTLCEPGTGESVLHMAVGSFRQSMLPMLIRYGADVNASGTNPEGQRALHIAAQYGNEEALLELIKSGTDVFAAFPDGRTALDVAAQAGQVNTASVLIDHGLDPLAVHGNKITSVYMAAIHDRYKILRYFLDRYAEVMPEALKVSLVIGAAGAGRLDILKLLKEKDFPILGTDDIGMSGLSIAAYFGHKDAVVYLLQQGADPRQRNSRNATSIDMAILGGHDDISNLVQDAERQRATNSGAELFPGWKYNNKDSVSDQMEMIATAMSVNATRRLKANQEPAGNFACNVCKDLDFRRGMPRDAEVVYFINAASMHTAASAGCQGCQFLSDCLARAVGAYGQGIWGNTPMGHFVLHSAAHGAPLLLHSHPSNPTAFPSRRIEIYVKEGSATTWPTVGIGRDVSLPGWSDERAAIARSYLQQCTTNHEHCPYRMGVLPTRVIWVGSATQHPRLYISNGERANYVSLSHCWGGVSPITTTTDTISQRVQGIAYQNLPKTFQDAITITRSLGVNYIWIDSLCIVQDSREDWNREAARMKDVYANCYAMIAVDDSPNPHGGCFAPDKDECRSSYAVDSVGPFLSKVKAFVRLTHMRDHFHMEVSHRIGDPNAAPELSRSILNQRGWCLQERVLAPRILHFGRSEFSWECPETVACECQPITTSFDKESRFKALLSDRILRDAQLGKEDSFTSEQVDIFMWMHFVEEFTRRQLTYHTDILHALSGMAGFMVAAARTEYACGLWKKELAEFLLWAVDYGEGPRLGLSAALPFRLQSSGQTPSSPVRPKRHESYYAPSWSWASLIGPIKFLVGRLDMSNKDQISHVRKDGKREEVNKNRISLLESVDIECTTDPLNPFGPPQHASLTVHGQTLPVTWTDKTKSANSTYSRSKNGGTLIFPSSSASSDTTPFAADFEPDLIDADLDVSIGDNFLLLYVLIDMKAKIAAHETRGGVPIAFAVEGKMLQGLVLVPVLTAGGNQYSSGAQPVYRRVGVFEAAGERWQEVASRRTITIV